MLSVIEIVQQLNKSQAKQLCLMLAKDNAYAELTLPIFNAYRNGENELSTQRSSNLNYNSFKIIERLIYRTILSFYDVEDISVKDLIQTTLFYAIYGSTQKSKNQKKIELEDLFHQLKRFQIDQQAAPLLKELTTYYKDTQLESVYNYMYGYYTKVEATNQRVIKLYVQFNQKLTDYQDEGNQSVLKELIVIYKQIRTLFIKNENPTAASFYYLCKLSLAILSDQKQILRDGSWEVEDLLSQSKHLIQELPFGMMRFYLQNIVTMIDVTHLYKNGLKQEASMLYNNITRSKLTQAYNFAFPNNYLSIHTAVAHKTIPLIGKQKIAEHFSFNKLNHFMQLSIHKNNFGRERLSLFLN
jgi:hypothetical protein